MTAEAALVLDVDDLKAQHTAVGMPESRATTSSSTDEEVEVDEWEREIKHRGMRITFQNLTYMVQNRANKSEKLAILKGISGYYLSGEMAAVMGPSGSGENNILPS